MGDRGRSTSGLFRVLAVVAGAATVMTLVLSGPVGAAEPSQPDPVTTTAGVPTCLPGQESVPASGSGTPAPLGNLQGLPADIAAGGTFAGVALTASQVEMAATIVAVGKQMGITRRGIEIGLSVATEQSSLRPEAINADWLGLFQQNPVTYTQYRRTEPGGASWMFYDQLVKLVPGYDTDPRQNFEIGDVIQKTTTGERFAQYQDMATALAGQLIDAVSLQQDDVVCTPAPAQQTTTGSVFDPGNIISDAVFYNIASMTVDQIRIFLRAEGEGCTGPYCLKNLTVTSADQPADRYCAAYRGGTNEDAATVIAKVSTACGISPQVMLVTLQKESGLLGRTDPTASTYNAAWGWHCPDTGPGGSANCDPAYAGFFNQGYGMAKQWSRYKMDPDKYNYRAGQTVNILWNVAESGCGSAPVTIANTATASLYIYTPYQPNAAALAAYPGVGDRCSAYGNRNFFYLFRKYFGSTGGGTSTTGATSAVLSTGTTVTIPNNQYVSTALAGQTITAPNAAVAAGLAAGFSALGLPYVWGGGGSGAGPNNGCQRGGGDFNSCGAEIGFDCSGLTAYVLGMAGYRTPGDSGSQRSGGTSISWAQALPGDIVGFPGHVAIYLGTFGGRPYILEASWVGTPVHIKPLTRTDVDDRVYRYWTGPAVSAPRVADFSTLVRNYTPTIDRYTPGGSSGSATGSGGGTTLPRTYTPTVPRITPRPYPAPLVAAPAVPVPAPAVPEPAPIATEPALVAPEPAPMQPADPAPSSPVPNAGVSSSVSAPSTEPSASSAAAATSAPVTTAPMTTAPTTTAPMSTSAPTTTAPTAASVTTRPTTTSASSPAASGASASGNAASTSTTRPTGTSVATGTSAAASGSVAASSGSKTSSSVTPTPAPSAASLSAPLTAAGTSPSPVSGAAPSAAASSSAGSTAAVVDSATPVAPLSEPVESAPADPTVAAPTAEPVVTEPPSSEPAAPAPVDPDPTKAPTVACTLPKAVLTESDGELFDPADPDADPADPVCSVEP